MIFSYSESKHITRLPTKHSAMCYDIVNLKNGGEITNFQKWVALIHFSLYEYLLVNIEAK